jgi:hypothetical protein
LPLERPGMQLLTSPFEPVSCTAAARAPPSNSSHPYDAQWAGNYKSSKLRPPSLLPFAVLFKHHSTTLLTLGANIRRFPCDTIMCVDVNALTSQWTRLTRINTFNAASRNWQPPYIPASGSGINNCCCPSTSLTIHRNISG